MLELLKLTGCWNFCNNYHSLS